MTNILGDQARREYENFFLGQPYTLSDYYGRYLMAQRQWTVNEKLAELPCESFEITLDPAAETFPAITADDIQAHMRELLSQVNIRILAMGNIYKDVCILLYIFTNELTLRHRKLSRLRRWWRKASDSRVYLPLT